MTTPSEATKLDAGQKHLLRLIEKEAVDGWAPCSAPVFKLLAAMPQELIEREPVGDEGRGRVRLTDQGQSVLDAMAWL